jgi:outer membrane usher protein
MTMRLPFGEIEIAAGLSRNKGLQGAASAVGYTYSAPLFSFGASVTGLSPHYATLSLKATDEHTRLATSSFVGFPVTSRTNLALQQTFENSNVNGNSHRVSLSTSTRVTEQLNLFLTGNYSRQQGGGAREMFAGLNYFFGKTTASLSYQQQGGKNIGLAGLQKSLPLGEGFGYRFQLARATDQTQVDGLLQYQGPYGRYEASYNRVDGQDKSVLSVAGGLAAIGGNIYFSRPIEQSFALVKVDGIAGVRGTLSNQEVGRTNLQGDLLIPDLLAYYGNWLGIADRDIPLNYSVDTSEIIIAPPFRGGAVVTFPVKRVQSLTGIILLDISGKIAAPAYGELTVTAAGTRFESPISKQGEFYLENLPAGHHPATVEYQGRVCNFTLAVPASEKPSVSLGTLHCVML